jgi:hypothetical protein
MERLRVMGLDAGNEALLDGAIKDVQKPSRRR